MHAMITEYDIESLDGFQNLDSDESWMSHDPTFEWSSEDIEEFHREIALESYELEAMAAWWDMEGVRCATFGRNPTINPYRQGVELDDSHTTSRLLYSAAMYACD